MRKLIINRILEIIGQGPRYDSYVVNSAKEFIAADVLKQDLYTKTGKQFIKQLDLSKFDFDKMIIQDEQLLLVFEIIVKRYYQQH